MPNFNAHKIPVFSGINDAPREPTASLAGNGSNIIHQFNNLIDELNTEVPNRILDTVGYESDIAWYVNSVTGDDNGNGFDQPFKTLDKALAVATNIKNSGGIARNILLEPGNYFGVNLPGFLPVSSSDVISIASASGNANDVSVQGYLPISLYSSGNYCLKNVRLKGAFSNGVCIFLNAAKIQLDNVIFGDVGSADSTIHIEAHNHSIVEVLSNYNIEGSVTKNHVFLDSFSFMDISYASPNEGRGIDVTNFTGSGQAFAVLQRSSYLSCWNTSFSGINEQITGKKFLLTGNSIIDTAGKDLNFFPGNQQGQLLQNSQYF